MAERLTNQQVIEAVPCPYCRAGRGVECRTQVTYATSTPTEPGRPVEPHHRRRRYAVVVLTATEEADQ